LEDLKNYDKNDKNKLVTEKIKKKLKEFLTFKNLNKFNPI